MSDESEDRNSKSRNDTGGIWYSPARAAVLHEFEAVEFKLRPTLIVTCAVLVMVLPHYHAKHNFVTTIQEMVGGKSFVALCTRFGWDYALVAQVGIPILFIIALRERLRDYGLGLGDVKTGLKLCGILYLVYIPCFIVLLLNPGFQEYYSWVPKHYTSWSTFFLDGVLAPASLGLQTEFLYRGFILFGVKKDYGPYTAALIQVIPYVLSHVGKAELETVGSLPVGLVLAYCALRTGSIWYGAFLHGSIALLFNVLILFIHFYIKSG